ncbi:MAG: hypothetical protein A3F91_15075 [Flavobacteria bacterium RIFCSPLOWO2_12_FULL_35_11]|nr:MAG: hypothetical protein A3F91_15075 [Flavobacteria bacterium RIFCSPLOWO2_12_FULL_35_11]
MAIKVVNALKYLGLSSIVFFTIISCEKEIETIGVNLVDNNNFSTNKDTSEVITTNEDILRVPASGVDQYLLGVYSDNEFGTLKASIVSQLGLPSTGDAYNYGTNFGIDSVLMVIPYQSTKEAEKYADGKPKFSIDSVIGDTNVAFQLGIYELKTFLNTLDLNDPSKPAIYYSDKEFQKGDVPFYSGNFKVNPNDTVSYIKRYMPNGVSVYKIDTIKATTISPSIKFPLNENLIKQIFVDNAAGAEFQSLDDFQHYFRGFYIEAEALTSNKAHLISLDMMNAKMIIYYSKDEDEGATVDLNGNKINGELGVRTKHNYEFAFGAIKSNVLKRDYTVSHQSGEDRLYVQGAAGSIATVKLFNNENLVDLQDNNWLINDANLIFYVDQNAVSDIAPEQLFIYNYTENLQFTDVMTEGIDAVGGKLERDDDGKPYRYVFKITDYISKLLKTDEPLELIEIGLKVYNPSDAPSAIDDVKIREYSWTPKGVVLFGQDPSFGDKRVKLEISYSKINN